MKQIKIIVDTSVGSLQRRMNKFIQEHTTEDITITAGQGEYIGTIVYNDRSLDY